MVRFATAHSLFSLKPGISVHHRHLSGTSHSNKVAVIDFLSVFCLFLLTFPPQLVHLQKFRVKITLHRD